MKTKITIAFFMLFFLPGLVLVAISQGIVNDAGYISGTSTNYVKFSGSGDAYLVSSTADRAPNSISSRIYSHLEFTW